MNRKYSLVVSVVVLALLMSVSGVIAQGPQSPQGAIGTAFTYQGQLKNASGPIGGNCDFQFSLWDALSGGLSLANDLSRTNVAVNNGLFTTPIDFGASVFTGSARWLEIGVRCPAGSGTYATLSPRQPLMPVPYALALPGLSTQQNSTSPNVIGGYVGNTVRPGVYGATLFGGGLINNTGYPNRVTDRYGTVSGGADNQAGNAAGTVDEAGYATVGGGVTNIAGANRSTVAGGTNNTAGGEWSTVGGGGLNIANGTVSTIAGGQNNAASGGHATIPGGRDNTAQGDYSFAAGQQAKAYHSGSFVWADATSGDFASTADNQFAVRASGGLVFTASLGALLRLIPIRESPNLIGGSSVNTVSPGVYGATIAGGGGIVLGPDMSGADNTAPTSEYYDPNIVTGSYGAVSGGVGNDASTSAAVGGGQSNGASGYAATIGGGYENTASGNYTAIGGGATNVASSGAATIGGGEGNSVSNNYGTVSGGASNSASAIAATVPGGYGAVASHYGQMAQASGYFGAPGDAQTSEYVLRGITTDGAAKPIYLDGQSSRLTIPVNRAMTFDILVVARNNTNASAGYVIRGMIENDDGTTRLVGAPSGAILGEDMPSWDCTIQANDTNNSLDIVVTGFPGMTVRWVATVRTAEVAW